MAIGGFLTEVTANHPTLGGFTFYPMANEDVSFDPITIMTEDDEESVDGSGNPVRKMKRKLPKIEFTLANDVNNREDWNAIKQLMENPVESDWTFSHSNGSVFGGNGKPVGNLEGNLTAATFPVIISCRDIKKIAG
jgi:hypothetical protein